jgi:hypothetical protein
MDAEMMFVSTKGYCEKKVDSMSAVSNSKLCGGVNKNVAYRYVALFPTCKNATYEFDLPTDFGHGGAVYLDNEFMVGSTKDIW